MPHPTPDEPSEFATTDAVIALASPMLRQRFYILNRSRKPPVRSAMAASPRSTL